MSLIGFRRCPGCHDSTEGNHIYKCGKCNYRGCEECWSGADCPECRETAYYAKLRELIGEIRDFDDDD